MKRIQSACLEQTILFSASDDLSPELAAKMVRQEVESYKLSLTRKQVAYKIEAETPQPDGSVIVMLRRQYNFYSCGSYLD